MSEGIDAVEASRRKRQRELQKLALEIRRNGQEYSKRKKRQVIRNDQQPKKKRVNVAPFQVVIIPIFWNQRAHEKKLVLCKVEEVEKLLTKSTFICYLDKNNKYTPGQRMKYWEEKQVKVRIELGPKDAESNVCTIARSRKPGEVAYKQTVEIGAEMCSAVTALLDMKDSEVPKPSVSAAQSPQNRKSATQQPTAGKNSAGDHQQGKGPTLQQRSAQKKAQGGDDLEDDFADIA